MVNYTRGQLSWVTILQQEICWVKGGGGTLLFDLLIGNYYFRQYNIYMNSACIETPNSIFFFKFLLFFSFLGTGNRGVCFEGNDMTL